MDLMTLAAKLELDDSSYRKGVTGAEAMGKQLAGKMSAMTVAVGNLAADMVRKGVAAINSVITGAIDGYADYQQLIGGVETLFKGSADKVAKYAQQSFKTTGLSSNQYMETVTSFSASLLQGLKGDTETAADLANMAVTDMADNANKMGTDISSIQAAYQGFAKQNYTMLDNLKLGYGGTASEMVRLINDSGILEKEIKDLDGITFDQLVEAIHKIQEQMGITGTTAKEAADTLSGSKASLEAAWADFLASVGGEQDKAKLAEAGDNFKAAFSTYVVDNLVPAIKTTIENTPELISAVSEAITSITSKAIGELAAGGFDVLTAGVNAATDITGWLIDGLVSMFQEINADPSKIAELGEAIGNFIGSAISSLVTNAGTIFEGVVNLGVGLAEGLADGLFKGLFGDGAEVDKISDALTGSLEDAEFAATKSGALIQYLRTLKDTYGDAVEGTTEWKEAVSELEQYIPNAGQVIKNFGKDIDGALNGLDKLAERMRDTAVNAALMTALQDSYGLLAEQNIEYRKQEARYNRNVSIQNDAEASIRDAIKQSAAKQAEEMWAQSHDEYGNVTDFFDETAYNDLISLSEGLSRIGDEFADIGDVDLDGLKSIVESLADPELEQSLKDEMGVIAEAQTEIDAAKDAMKESQKEIDATKKEIEYVKEAVAAAAKDMGSSFTDASSSVTSGGDAVGSALDNLAKRIAGIRFVNGVTYMPKATGIEYVPFNGFKAELHKGETILTPKQAEAYRNGGGASEVVGALQGVRQDLQNMRLVVGKKTFGRAVVDYGGRGMSGYIGQSDSRQAAGYGT